MFSIGVSEILLIVVVGCLVTDPKKMPSVVRAAGSYYRKFEEVRSEVIDFFHKACGPDEGSSAAKSISSPRKKIVGNDGKVYEAYEVSEIIGNGCATHQHVDSTSDNDAHKTGESSGATENKTTE